MGKLNYGTKYSVFTLGELGRPLKSNLTLVMEAQDNTTSGEKCSFAVKAPENRGGTVSFISAGIASTFKLDKEVYGVSEVKLGIPTDQPIPTADGKYVAEYPVESPSGPGWENYPFNDGIVSVIFSANDLPITTKDHPGTLRMPGKYTGNILEVSADCATLTPGVVIDASLTRWDLWTCKGYNFWCKP
jgi:hypothetical protein